MQINFVEELRWRGLLHDIMPGTEERLQRNMTTGYIGFDPTAASLTIGNLVTIMMLVHFQRAGHKPLALVGGATGMIGDPSGKSAERNLLSLEVLRHNETCIKKQLEKFLDFGTNKNSAEIVNNYDWYKDLNVLDFLRHVGKHLTVNYMMAKESVQKRLDTGISFTEFSYQLLQGYDFCKLYKEKGCDIQMGGSDQWGNITAGTELTRRMEGGETFALTCPLVTKADGTKFGKSESGNIWLDPALTSPYKFFQFWINCADEDAARFIKIFTLLDKAEVIRLTEAHAQSPQERILQKAIAKEVTTRVHSLEDYETAVEASEILFGKGTTETLNKLPEGVLLNVFEGVPRIELSRSAIENAPGIVEFLSDLTGIFPSRGEAKKMLQGGGVFINKGKIEDAAATVSSANLLNDRYIIAQKGKKNYYLVVVS